MADRGGLAKLATIIKNERTAGRQVIVAHAGNAISPSLASGFDQGARMMQILGRLGIDVMAFGNHEFDFGASVASGRALEANFPVILANVRGPDGQPLAGLSPTWVYERGGFRIAFIGLVRADLTEVFEPRRRRRAAAARCRCARGRGPAAGRGRHGGGTRRPHRGGGARVDE